MSALFLCSLCLALGYPDPTGPVESARYLRPTEKQFETECTFTLESKKGGVTIESVTLRGKTKLIVTTSYDDKDRLASAQAVLHSGETVKTATVSVNAGKAKVERAGKSADEFDVPASVIVTSAPDWTDTFLLCRRYDRKKGGKQTFPGLWIHPVEANQRSTFSIEKAGADVIGHAQKKLTLDRFTIRLRGNSAYAAWADGQGKMIKLVALPHKEGAKNWLVLEGYEKSAAPLRP